MKKNKTVLFGALVLSLFFAQNLSAISFEDICSGLSKRANTIGEFTQTKKINSNGRQLKSSGVYIICPDGIMWKTIKPFPLKLVLTKTQMIQTSADGRKSVINGAENQVFKNISSILSSVFSGDSEQLKNNFETEFFLVDDGWRIELTPKDSTIASAMTKLVLSGEAKGKDDVSMNRLEILEASDNSIVYEFSNQRYPKELTLDE